jgi:HPr kinase/phosphorylase
MPVSPLIVHGTTVALGGRAVLLTGRAGAGKSSTALAMIALGATLVADDQTILTSQNGKLIASCPAPLRGLIEARGLGLLNAPTVDLAEVTLCADLDQDETERLPPRRYVTFLRHRIDLVHRVTNGHFPAALLHYMQHGRSA